MANFQQNLVEIAVGEFCWELEDHLSLCFYKIHGRWRLRSVSLVYSLSVTAKRVSICFRASVGRDYCYVLNCIRICYYIILSFDVFRIWTLQDKMLTKSWKEERKSPILKKEQVLYFLWYFPPNFNLPIRFDNCGHLITKNHHVLPVLVSFSLQYWSLFFLFSSLSPKFLATVLLHQFTLNCFNRNYFGHWFIKFPTLNVWFCLFLRSL